MLNFVAGNDVSALLMSWKLKLTCHNNVMMLSIKFTDGSSLRPVCGPGDSLKHKVGEVRLILRLE